MRRLAIATIGLAALVLSGPARADDLTGADKLLCSAGSASTCCDDGLCATGTAAELGVPQFLEIDLAGKRISTTKASGLNRVSVVAAVTRADGRIIVQGVDGGRGYSLVIKEKSGELAAAVAGGECSVMAYGSCTLLPASK
jgi:hypothetical protein